MQKPSPFYRCPVALILIAALSLISWGKFGHDHINRGAVMALPTAMQPFFYNHVDFITEESNIPDQRKYLLKDSAEFQRHFIDLETYGNVDSIPRSYKAAKAKYGAAFLKKNGLLPWYLQQMMEDLTSAFKTKQKTTLLFLAADLGHYIGDGYMPLHTTVNHSGMRTNHKGIHALFESQMPEQLGEKYNFHTRTARYIPDIEKESWRIVLTTFKSADTMLLADRELSKTMTEEQIFVFDNGKIKMNMYGEPVHTLKYARLYQAKLNGMVEKLLRGAAASTADFWYTAWVNAGKPDLNKMDPPALTKRNAPLLAAERAMWLKGKLFGIQSDTEF